jgi:WD40 repeat protein
VQTALIHHAYPTTRVQWAPTAVQREGVDMLATVGDYLRLWEVPTTPAAGGRPNSTDTSPTNSGGGGGGGGGSSAAAAAAAGADGAGGGGGGGGSSASATASSSAANEAQEDADIGESSLPFEPAVITRPKHLFDSNKTKDSCTPLTNMDWNPVAVNVVGCCCIDPICTIWDVEACKIQSKILAHGSSVFALQFKPEQQSIFATVGADGSLRLFDLRNLRHSAIVFETEEKKPLLRLDWNHNTNKIAILDVDGDVRFSGGGGGVAVAVCSALPASAVACLPCCV